MGARHRISSLEHNAYEDMIGMRRWRTGCISLNKRFENTHFLASDQPYHESTIILNIYIQSPSQPSTLTFTITEQKISLHLVISTNKQQAEVHPCTSIPAPSMHCINSSTHKPHRTPFHPDRPTVALNYSVRSHGVCPRSEPAGITSHAKGLCAKPITFSNIGAACKREQRGLALGPPSLSDHF